MLDGWAGHVGTRYQGLSQIYRLNKSFDGFFILVKVAKHEVYGPAVTFWQGRWVLHGYPSYISKLWDIVCGWSGRDIYPCPALDCRSAAKRYVYRLGIMPHCKPLSPRLNIGCVRRMLSWNPRLLDSPRWRVRNEGWGRLLLRISLAHEAETDFPQCCHQMGKACDVKDACLDRALQEDVDIQIWKAPGSRTINAMPYF